MRHFVQIERRCFAAVGILALALAYLPGVACLLNAAPACCTGTMCPMHNAAGGHTMCGMDMTHPGAAFQSCECHSVQYTGGFVFNRVAPPVTDSQRVTSAAPALLRIAFPSLAPEVASPPPRFALS
jgi:hypothetical protein